MLIRRRRPGYIGPLHSLQLLIIQLTLFAALAAFAYGTLAGTTAVIAALALICLTLARWRGRWLLERRVMVSGYRQRRRLTRQAGRPAASLSVLRRLSPDLKVENVPVAGGRQVGVAHDDSGWFAAAQVTPGVMAAERPDVPLDLLAASIADTDQAGAVIQVVVQTVPAAQAERPSPAERSYRDLLSRVGGQAMLVDRVTCVVVRIDARGLAEALGDHNADVSSAPAVVASLLRRLVTSLRQADVTASMLDADGLVTFLARSCDPEPAAGSDTTAYLERWSMWRSSQLAHRTFWINGWPSPSRSAAMFEALFAVPTAATSISLTLDPDPRSGLVDLTALVRVSAPPSDLGRACRAMLRAARGAKGDLFALDGEQAPATWASAPTGGGAR